MLRIERFAPWQAAKVMGILYVLMGLILMPFFLLAAFAQADGFSLGLALALPGLYGVFGAIMVALGCALYNLVARFVGGIEVQLSAPPPPPAQPDFPAPAAE